VSLVWIGIVIVPTSQDHQERLVGHGYVASPIYHVGENLIMTVSKMRWSEQMIRSGTPL
jgi:hypothetical protein